MSQHAMAKQSTSNAEATSLSSEASLKNLNNEPISANLSDMDAFGIYGSPNPNISQVQGMNPMRKKQRTTQSALPKHGETNKSVNKALSFIKDR